MLRTTRWLLTILWVAFVVNILTGVLPEAIAYYVNWSVVVLGAIHLVEMWIFKARIQSATNPKLEALYIFLYGAAQGLDKSNQP